MVDLTVERPRSSLLLFLLGEGELFLLMSLLVKGDLVLGRLLPEGVRGRFPDALRLVERGGAFLGKSLGFDGFDGFAK